MGSPVGKPIDVRIIAATNRDLEDQVAAGHFRADLYYRLTVVSLRTIPLKDRPEDIEVLARHILHKLAIDAGFPLKRLSPGALELFRLYDWPGNVRELSNQLERAAVFSESEVLGAEAFAQLIDFCRGSSRRAWPAWRDCPEPPTAEPPRLAADASVFAADAVAAHVTTARLMADACRSRTGAHRPDPSANALQPECFGQTACHRPSCPPPQEMRKYGIDLARCREAGFDRDSSSPNP